MFAISNLLKFGLFRSTKENHSVLRNVLSFSKNMHGNQLPLQKNGICFTDSEIEKIVDDVSEKYVQHIRLRMNGQNKTEYLQYGLR